MRDVLEAGIETGRRDSQEGGEEGPETQVLAGDARRPTEKETAQEKELTVSRHV